MPQPQPHEICLNDLTIRGLRSAGDGNHLPKALLLHGWLDNANSFLPILPMLNNLDALAIDLPGHGHSDHWYHNVPYTIASTVHYVMRVADALEWESFHLIGHSLGGSIAPLCAMAEPARIQSLTLIDAVGPVSESAEALPGRLHRFHREMTLRKGSASRVFSNIESAIDTRLIATKMKYESARLIVERQLKSVDAGLQWRFDPALRAASPSYFTEEQVQCILKAIHCPTLCIVATEGYLAESERLHERLACIKTHLRVDLEGNHHLHIDNPEPVALTINEFTQTQK
jgi:pimeloyl-ACP methyl ester carboxylesterase